MGKVYRLALALTIIGALNWGLAGFFRFDVVAQLAGGATKPLARFIYMIIGISGLFNLSLLFDHWRYRNNVNVASPEEA